MTAILAFGDNRELQFFLCRHKKKLDGNNRGPHLVDPEPWVFDLKHGTLFILHPEDEMLLDRFYHVGDQPSSNTGVVASTEVALASAWSSV